MIAVQGYTYTSGTASSVAFFPLFPLLIRYTDRNLTGRATLAGLVVVHLALVAAIYTYQLVRLDYRELIAWRTLFSLLAFPGALFIPVVYPELVFLLGLAGALYDSHRGKWIRARFFGIVVSATKLLGIVVPLLVELLSQGTPLAAAAPASRRDPRPTWRARLSVLAAVALRRFSRLLRRPALLDAAVVRAGHSAGREAVDGRTQRSGLLPADHYAGAEHLPADGYDHAACLHHRGIVL